MKTIQISEGAIKLLVPDPKKYRLTAKAPVFYNPAMISSRDISVLLAKVLKPISAVDLLAATGVRGLRIKKEAKIKDVYINDANPLAFNLMKRNAKLNKLKVNISELRAHEFLATRYKLKHKKFHYLDIDPFGTPVPFLDAGVKAIVETGGVIAVTATDTSNLCGTYPSSCLRKYGAKPLRNYLMNEIGSRILIKKVQEMGAMYDLALTPIFCHATRHYMRAYLRAERGAEETNKVLKQIGMFKGAGPMWLGPLYDTAIVEKMQKLAAKDKFISKETKQLLYTIKEESKINTPGFFDLTEFHLKQIPKLQKVLEKLWMKGFKAARTHFSRTGIKTNATEEEFAKLLRPHQ
ncbi:MAG: tRNA (guanine(26)-N(2))-dimethyltransferase [Candidatus Nanoarchaeia archaeon]